MFHLISADPTTVSSSLNSNATVIPSLSFAESRPSVGPLPHAVADDVKSFVPSPFASWIKPFKIISPVKIPVSVPVSASL